VVPKFADKEQRAFFNDPLLVTVKEVPEVSTFFVVLFCAGVTASIVFSLVFRFRKHRRELEEIERRRVREEMEEMDKFRERSHAPSSASSSPLR